MNVSHIHPHRELETNSISNIGLGVLDYLQSESVEDYDVDET